MPLPPPPGSPPARRAPRRRAPPRGASTRWALLAASLTACATGPATRTAAREPPSSNATTAPSATSSGASSTPSTNARVVLLTARKWAFTPETVTLALGAPVILELTSVDGHHGFRVPELGLRADLQPGVPVRLALTPTRPGTYPFHCDVFCGDGHEDMAGAITVTP